MKKSKYVYTIFYLERKYFHTINQDLKDYGFEHVKAIVPTVKVLRKAIKGKLNFEEVPILFNYGFIRMPLEKAYSRPFLNKLKKKIPGIRSFLKDTQTIFPKKKRARIDNAEDFDDFSIVATCPRSEVRRFKRLSRENKKFSVDDITSIKIGDYLVLKVYPYEGVDATVLDINYQAQTVKLMLYPENGKMEINVPFNHVLYSVYSNYDEDKLYANSREYDSEKITEESIESILSKKRI